MGKCETATVSIGIKILLSDLVKQINAENMELVKEMLLNGFIEDENGLFNESFQRCILDGSVNSLHRKDHKRSGIVLGHEMTGPGHFGDQMVNNVDPDVLKRDLEREFTRNGNLLSLRGYNELIPTLEDGCLLDQYLLVYEQDILSTSRWGYDRMGVNGKSTPIDFNLFLNRESLEKYKMIEGVEVVFMIQQSSG